MEPRVVITGMGAVTPIGIGVENYWNGLIEGRCGIGEIRRIDTADLPVTRAAEVWDFQVRDYLPNRLAMDLEPFAQYAYVAAMEAAAQSGLDTHSTRVGVVMGSALSGFPVISAAQERFTAEQKQAGPKLLTKALANLAASQFAIGYGIQGPCMTVETACSSGGDAITLASLLLRSGQADAMVVMAGEAAICPTLIQSLTKTGALSRIGESRPFDRNRSGFVIGEGGGALILETKEHARARQANVLAELLGCANNTDAHHPVSPEPTGAGAAKCMQLALADAGLQPEQIDYINAHGTATLRGDAAEACAIHRVFGDRPVHVSSSKGATGHMMGAGGITEVVACIKTIETGMMPPNLGYTERDEACDLSIVTAKTGKQKIDIALSNAMGFGGQNACVIVGQFKNA